MELATYCVVKDDDELIRHPKMELENLVLSLYVFISICMLYIDRCDTKSRYSGNPLHGGTCFCKYKNV